MGIRGPAPKDLVSRQVQEKAHDRQRSLFSSLTECIINDKLKSVCVHIACFIHCNLFYFLCFPSLQDSDISEQARRKSATVFLTSHCSSSPSSSSYAGSQLLRLLRSATCRCSGHLCSAGERSRGEHYGLTNSYQGKLPNYSLFQPLLKSVQYKLK